MVCLYDGILIAVKRNDLDLFLSARLGSTRMCRGKCCKIVALLFIDAIKIMFIDTYVYVKWLKWTGKGKFMIPIAPQEGTGEHGSDRGRTLTISLSIPLRLWRLS